MTTEFKAEEWVRLPAAQRVKQCRDMAEEVRALGAGAAGEAKRACIELALNWDRLADEIEGRISKPTS